MVVMTVTFWRSSCLVSQDQSSRLLQLKFLWKLPIRTHELSTEQIVTCYPHNRCLFIFLFGAHRGWLVSEAFLRSALLYFTCIPFHSDLPNSDKKLHFFLRRYCFSTGWDSPRLVPHIFHCLPSLCNLFTLQMSQELSFFSAKEYLLSRLKSFWLTLD